MTPESIDKLIDIVISRAPELWSVVEKQVQIKLWESFIGFLVCVCITIVCIWLMLKDRDKYIDYRDELDIMCLLIALIMVIIIIFLLSSIARILINPDFVAINILLDLVK